MVDEKEDEDEDEASLVDNLVDKEDVSFIDYENLNNSKIMSNLVIKRSVIVIRIIF